MSPTAGSEPLRALIVGCGAIAGGYDEASPESAQVLTHAKAYRNDPRFAIAACVEPDAARRTRFMDIWGVPAGFASLAEVNVAYDVASVCVPTRFHAETLEALLPGPARLVFAEKPLTDELERSRAIVAAYEAAGKPLAVNYLRRWAPGLARLRAEIAGGGWGTFQKGSAWYTKGLLNNASHFLDLLAFLLGPLAPVAALGRVADGRDDDPTLDVVVAAPGGGPIHLLGADMNAFSVFEADLLFSGGRIGLTDSAFQIIRRPVEDSPRFAGYRTLAAGAPEDSGLGRAIPEALDNIARHLSEGVPLAGDGRSALAAQDLCARLVSLWESRS